MKKSIFMLFTLVFLCSSIQAQSKKNPTKAPQTAPAAAPVEKPKTTPNSNISIPKEAIAVKAENTPVTQNPEDFIRGFYEAQNKFLSGSAEMESKVAQHMHPEFMYLRNTEDVKGLVRTVRFNKDEFMRELKATKGFNIRIERKIHQVIYNHQIGNLANISVILEINFYQDTTKVATSGAFISHSLANSGGVWAIRNMLGDRVVLNQSIGVCGTAIKRNSPEVPETYNVKVVFPVGDSYETIDHAILVKNEGPIKLFDVDKTNYYTLKDGILYTAKIGGNQIMETLGKAPSVNEALVLILSKSLYKDKCFRFEGIK